MSSLRPMECMTGDEVRAPGAWATARATFEEALEMYLRSGAPFEAGRARAVLEALRQLTAEVAPARVGEINGALSRREIEVLRLVAEGLNNRSIARRLFVSGHTVHRHLANVFGKLAVSSRAAAVAQAARRGLLG